MELLFLNHNVIWRSAFHRCFHLAKPLAARGHRVTILTNSARERSRWKESRIEGIRVVESPDLLAGPLRTGWDPVNVLRRNRWVVREYGRRRGEDFLVHAFDTRPTVVHPALRLKARLGCPLVMDWGDWWGRGGAIRLRKPLWLNLAFEPVETWYEEHYKLSADWLTCVSRPLEARATELGFPRDRITVIPNPSEPDATRPLDRHECRMKLGLDPGTFYAIFSGYVLYDLDLVLGAMQALAKRVGSGARRSVGLILTGAKHGLDPARHPFRLVETGTVSREELNRWLCAANAALMPLRDHVANRARFPGKVGDYLAAGLPIVMNRVGDLARILDEQGLGTFCACAPEAFGQELLALKDNPTHAEELGRRGRAFAETRFNWETEAARLLAVYETLLARL
ncbi:MAG: glycosyltransferase family 4 protein [Verrucomicrobiae bacterium]|nr:glycosyltransferase family 4 protein [Verrucomicrobiae bacterium]